MKEIGEALKEARENIGLSIEEVASDLKVRPSQVENIESGNLDAFKDLFYMKYFIKDYSKYLGLSYEDMVDEFNEYLFDYTSKISLDDIKKAKKKSDRQQLKKEKRVSSPYTIERRQNFKIKYVLIAVIAISVCILVGIGIREIVKNQPKENTTEQNNIIK